MFWGLLFLLLKYSEYEKVVIEDRIEKEKIRRQAEQEEEELKAAINVCNVLFILYMYCMVRILCNVIQGVPQKVYPFKFKLGIIYWNSKNMSNYAANNNGNSNNTIQYC